MDGNVPCRSSGRKRSLDDLQQMTESMELSQDTVKDERSQQDHEVSGLRLEAIFHPKFDNENREDREIRSAMKSRVSNGRGYLEVSLKHSGTLLLWSGDQRYYSKNSTGNPFTSVGEVLLRQHFARAWPENLNMYDECGAFVEKERLTLAFEVVTAVLGHHGDLPRRDFLVMTAIADRSQQRFFSTVEVLELAQKFRLPHNDVWVYSTPESVDPLFHIYDSTREVGLAKDTIAALDVAATVRIESMYPHEVFQGDILEGFVIRFVPMDAATREKSSLNKLAAGAKAISDVCPPSTPPSFSDTSPLASSQLTSVLSTDIRDVFRQCVEEHGYKSNLIERFGTAVLTLLQESDSQRRSVSKAPRTAWNIPKLAGELLESSSLDEETRRIARTLVKAASLKARIEYSIFREAWSNAKDRTLCIVHVFHDQTFKKYHNAAEDGDMPLYRGFCIELERRMKGNTSHAGVFAKTAASFRPDEASANLMLKMKFLPYMVRTFGCRNGLKAIKAGGPSSFGQYTMKLMRMWGLSDSAIAKWQPWFRLWGLYASSVLSGDDRYLQGAEQLPPLTEAFYLDHLNHFQTLLDNGKIIDTCASSTMRGLFVVVALQRETACKVADVLSEKLGGVQRLDDINKVSIDLVTEMLLPSGGGIILSACPADSAGKLKRNVKRFADSTMIILIGCDEQAVSDLPLPVGDRKRMLGQLKGWRSSKFKKTIEASSVDDNLLTALRAFSDGAQKIDSRPGMLVFFPGIPGSGKSAITAPDALNELHQSLAKGTPDSRKTKVLMGDRVKGKYWSCVKEERLSASSTILIADKNAPPSAWRTVGQSTGRGKVVAVLPDSNALRTTQVIGLRRPSGDLDMERKHHYPFSLSYLAVCIARVLQRAAKSHAGKLDVGTPAAAMIVIKFFGFYRNVAADEMADDIRTKVGSGGALALPTIQIPFFSKEPSDLPEDLKEALVEAIRIQYGYDSSKGDSTDMNDELIQNTETGLRDLIRKYSDALMSMTAKFSVSLDAFVNQVSDRVRDIGDDTSTINTSASSAAFVKIVSIDVPKAEVHEALKERATEIRAFLSRFDEGEVFTNPQFVESTHVTMAHFRTSSQAEIHGTYDAIVGSEVDIEIHSLLFDDNIAALAVQLNSTINESCLPLPKSTNAFVHMTLWLGKSVQAVESNKLPKKEKKGLAERIVLSPPIRLTGTLAFWSAGQSSKKKQKNKK